VGSICNKLHYAEIIPEQSVSKIVKNISTDGKVMSKITVISFFRDTVYNI